MALSALADPTPKPRASVSDASLVDGDILVPDAQVTRMLVGQGHTVRIDERGPYVACHGHERCRHHLDRDTDASGMVIGMRRYRPAPVKGASA